MYMTNEMVEDVTKRLKNFKLTFRQYGSELRGDTLLVLKADNLTHRFSLAHNLLSHFADLAALCVENRQLNVFHIFGSTVAKVILGECEQELLDFNVMKKAPITKRFANLKLSWGRTLEGLLKQINKSPDHEPSLFEKFRKFTADAKTSLISKKQEDQTKKEETLKQKHARLQYLLLEDLFEIKNKGSSNQFLSEMLVDRKQGRFPWLNIQAQLVCVEKPKKVRHTVHVPKKVLLDFVKTKKELGWFKDKNQRVFVNNHGNFFRNDGDIKHWMRNYLSRTFK